MVPKDDGQTVEKDGGVQGDTVDFYLDGAWAASYIFFNPDSSTTGYEISTRVDLSVTTEDPSTFELSVTSCEGCTVTVEVGPVLVGTVDYTRPRTSPSKKIRLSYWKPHAWQLASSTDGRWTARRYR
jgi:hypothetical protein